VTTKQFIALLVVALGAFASGVFFTSMPDPMQPTLTPQPTTLTLASQPTLLGSGSLLECYAAAAYAPNWELAMAVCAKRFGTTKL